MDRMDKYTIKVTCFYIREAVEDTNDQKVKRDKITNAARRCEVMSETQ